MPHILSNPPRPWCAHPVFLWGLLGVLGCKPDTGFKIHEDLPTATILEPGTADTFVELSPIAFRAQLDDKDDGVDSLTVRWRSDVAGTLDGEGALEGKVHSFVAEGLPLGAHTIMVEATDPDGNTAEDQIKISVVENSAPQIEITAPAADSIWSDTDTIWVAVRVSDHEEEAAALRLEWTLDEVAVLDAEGSTDDAGGAVHGFEGVDIGEHSLVVMVMDAQGATSSANISFAVIYGDEDGDGYIAEEVGGEDCDDSDRTVNPEAIEVCDEIDNDCDDLIDTEDPSLDGGYIGYPDRDGDGFGASEEAVSCEAGVLIADDSDCQDDDASIHPDQEESCNEIDDDCDDLIDGEDPDTDVDGDGYSVCDADCADEDAAVSPDAVELCDGIDNDCDGLVDDSSALDAITWFRDGDGDGYGDPDSTNLACTLPSGYTSDDADCDDSLAEVNPVADEICNEIDDDCDGLIDSDDPETDRDGDGFSACADDCDDADPAVHPDATEVCDSIDNDCDGTTDGETAVDATTYYRDADGDGYGSMDISTLACSEPSGHVDDTTDCNDGDTEIHPGALEVCGDGIDNDCDGVPGDCKWSGEVTLDGASHVTYGEDEEDRIGSSLGHGDLDGDGFPDLVIGAHRADPVAMHSGAVYLVPGPLTESWGSLADHASVRLDGSSYTDYAGWALAVADLDGDGQDDLLVGAPQEDTVGSNAGTVSIFYGPLVDSGMLEDSPATIYGESSEDRLGSDVDVGDINGDGVSDIVVSAEENDSYASEAGAAYLFLGDGLRESGAVDSADADTRFYATQSDMDFGTSVLFAGDVNGDGLDDLFIAAPRSDGGGIESAGGVYLFLGHASSYGTGSARLHTMASAEYLGAGGRDYSGFAMAVLGDVDGDSRTEFAVTAPYTDAMPDRDLGTVYLMLSPALSGTSELETDADVVIRGSADDNALGFGIAGNFDLDADGHMDLAISAPDERRTRTNQGVTYLLYGPITDLPAEMILGGDEDASFLGEMASDRAGSLLMGGDLNDDGLDDLTLSAPGMTPPGASVDEGAAYVLFGGGM